MGTKLDGDNDRHEHQNISSVTLPPPVIPPSTPSFTYAASETLAKKLILPNRERWRVPVEDVYMEGQLLIYVKTKWLMWDWYSKVKERSLTLTRRGFLVIYMKGNKGYIIDVSAAKSIECTTDCHEKNSYFRTHIKLKYGFGNVHLWGFLQNGLDWKLALQRAYERSIPPYRPPVITSKRATLPLSTPLPHTEKPMPPKPLKYEKTEENEVSSVDEFCAQVVESEYLAIELRSIDQMKSAVSWMSISDWVTETEEPFRKGSSIKDFSPKLRDTATNIPSVTHMQRFRRFLRKSHPMANRTVSAPHILREPIVEESPAKAVLFPASTNDLSTKDASTPKHAVTEIRSKFERTPSTRPPSDDKKDLYHWIKKTARSPEKKAKIEMEESMILIQYGKALGWGRRMIGTDSEANV